MKAGRTADNGMVDNEGAVDEGEGVRRIMLMENALI
jgi:hypothetical protein